MIYCLRHSERAPIGRKRSIRGVSLFELLVTISLVSVITSVAVQRVGPVLDITAGRAASQEITAALRLTRMRAIAQNNRFRVQFDTSNARFTVEREATPGNFIVDQGPFDLPGQAAITNVTPADPIFDSRGAVGATTTITSAAPHSTTRTITINPLGRITES
jgi:type II secretory pathway pseudopilin PulG